MTDTISAESHVKQLQFSKSAKLPLSMSFSMQVEFSSVVNLLSGKPLARPGRTRPANRRITNSELLKLASQNPPPQEWFNTEEECPFDLIDGE